MLQAGGDFETGFVILSGHVELRTVSGALVEQAGQGAVLGAVSLLFGGAQEFTATAKDQVEAAMVDRATVSAQLSRNPELVREAAGSILARLDLVPKAERAAEPTNHESPVAAPAGNRPRGSGSHSCWGIPNPIIYLAAISSSSAATTR